MGLILSEVILIRLNGVLSKDGTLFLCNDLAPKVNEEKKRKFKLQNVLTENKINKNKLVQILKVISPSTVNGMSNEDIKKANIETLTKVADHFKINDIRELLEIIIEDEENANMASFFMGFF
ncbi:MULTISPECIES: helix-turn-helix domain-containing protein [Bacillus cereus group]|uniref:helix-turn-helix domain-containing protein n=1 Tax=Bacillus cereus group TaxID=86661 RepID=UPI000BEC137D|nr:MULTISPECIES: helix-turn-helix transcriptional regulator [Bacillus cereus group]PEF51000.1 hypothetical protein CON56_18400 [Bacillus thuringiensis]PFC29700.1 hypothetical protein CN299_15525 [Bacillus thuringiensis]PFO96242.1 hypothetical protein COJ97_25010 [Bacillus cereus]